MSRRRSAFPSRPMADGAHAMPPRARRADPQAPNIPPLPWWRAPVEGWPHKLTITSLLTGRAVTVDLRDGTLERRPAERPR
jgi:hypothetical protein